VRRSGQQGASSTNNLAEVISELELNDLAIKYIYNIDADREARKLRDEHIRRGIEAHRHG